METKTKITLPNGMTVEGTPEQVMDVVNKLGMTGVLRPQEYYRSETHGWIKISDMNTMHLRNAILKQYRLWVADMQSISNPKALVSMILDGIEDITWNAMLVEYSKRKEE